VVPVFVVEVTAQIVPREGSQIATSINEDPRLDEVMFFGEAVEKRRPQKSWISDERARAVLSLTPRGLSHGD
jgi:hypothetical protein